MVKDSTLLTTTKANTVSIKTVLLPQRKSQRLADRTYAEAAAAKPKVNATEAKALPVDLPKMERKVAFDKGNSTGKSSLAMEIYHHIQGLNPPGCFLKKADPNSEVPTGELIDGTWEQLSEEKALHKTCQVMCDIARPEAKVKGEEEMQPKRKKKKGNGNSNTTNKEGSGDKICLPRIKTFRMKHRRYKSRDKATK